MTASEAIRALCAAWERGDPDALADLFSEDGAVKDTALIVAAVRESGTDATLMDAVAGQFRKAAGGGHGGEDMAAVYRAFRR